jgi:hypothetical protein
MELIGEAPKLAVAMRSVATMMLTVATRSTSGRSWLETGTSSMAVSAFICLSPIYSDGARYHRTCFLFTGIRFEVMSPLEHRLEIFETMRGAGTGSAAISHKKAAQKGRFHL